MTTGAVDFSISTPVLSALVIGILQPAYLWAATRIPALAGRNALQFALSSATTFVLWASALLVGGEVEGIDILVGAMILVAGAMVYLEIWALMSRGYTLGMLLTLLATERPLDERELARRYRGGDGLSWIMHHRVGGLIAAGLVRRDGDRLALASAAGLAVAWIYKICVTVLGLRRTG
jgi:hypothetical protein